MSSIVHNFVTSGFKVETGSIIDTRLKFINIFSTIGIVTLALFGTINGQRGNLITAIVELGFAAVLINNLVLLRIFRERYLLIASYVMSITIFIPLLALLYLGGLAGTGFLWYSTYPIIIFSLFDRRRAVLQTVLLFLATVIFMGLQALNMTTLVYNNAALLQLLANFLVITLLSYFYGYTRDQQLDILAMQRVKLYAANQQLTRELSLDSNRNKDLEDTKKAMVNLLEDLEEDRRALSATTARDEAVLGSMGEGLAVADNTGKLTYTNNIANEILGVTQQGEAVPAWSELFGLFKLDGKTPFPSEELPLARAIHGESLDNVEMIVRNANHSSGRSIQVTARPVKTKSGEVLGGVVIFRDITQAKAIDRAKTEFVSLASHQLRTPLTAIGWYAEMLLAGDAGAINETQSDYLKEIQNSNRRMVELVGSLLNVSRLELGTFTIQPQAMDIVDCAKSVVNELRSEIDHKHLIFSEDYDAVKMIQADPKLLRMVIQNLLSNAVKYTPDGGAVSIQLESLTRRKKFGGKAISGASLGITVTDSGYGIPANQQDKIFSKLFRADNVQTHDVEGTGLGLYIVKEIIEQSGGQVWFTSVENKGSTFYVTLPTGGMKAKTGTKALA